MCIRDRSEGAAGDALLPAPENDVGRFEPVAARPSGNPRHRQGSFDGGADHGRPATGPVSYTHLDVYKRQAVCPPHLIRMYRPPRMARVTLASGQPSFLAAEGIRGRILERAGPRCV